MQVDISCVEEYLEVASLEDGKNTKLRVRLP